MFFYIVTADYSPRYAAVTMFFLIVTAAYRRKIFFVFIGILFIFAIIDYH